MPTVRVFGVDLTYEWSYQLGSAPAYTAGRPPATYLPSDWDRPDNSHIRLVSAPVNFRVKFSGDKPDEIDRVGFTNTIYSQTRRWFYVDDEENGASGVRLTEVISPVPTWDGGGDDDSPWYNGLTYIDDFDEGLTFNDQPNLPPYPVDEGVENPLYPFGKLELTIRKPSVPKRTEELFYIEGIEEYEAIVVAESDGELAFVDSVPWYVIWDAYIDHWWPALVRRSARSGTYVAQTAARRTIVTDTAGSADSKVPSRDTWQERLVSPAVQAALLKRRQSSRVG